MLNGGISTFNYNSDPQQFMSACSSLNLTQPGWRADLIYKDKIQYEKVMAMTKAALEKEWRARMQVKNDRVSDEEVQARAEEIKAEMAAAAAAEAAANTA